MKFTHPRPESRNSRTFAAILLALFTFASPLSPLFAAAAQSQDAGRPAAGASRRGGQPDKGGEKREGGGSALKAPDLSAPSAVSASDIAITLEDDIPLAQKKRPGGPITYTAKVRNNHATDAATAVQFINDLTANPNIILDLASVQSQPIAYAETYDVLGNVRLNVTDAAEGLLQRGVNDFDPDGTPVRITAADTTSARGGEVNVNTADGTFTYNPPAGYDGPDSFTYTIKDAGPDNTPGNADDATDTATVKLNVAGMIWFVQAGAASCTSRADGCGRLSNPFSDLQSFQSAQGGAGANNGDTVDPEAGDNIFLYAGAYTGPLTLLNTQKVIGQGASDTLQTISGVTVPQFSDPLPDTKENNNALAAPAITSGATGILIGANNTLRGFNIGNVGVAQAKIQGTSFGTLDVGKAAAGERDVTLSGTGRILSLTTGAFSATSGFNGVSSTESSGEAALFLSGVSGTVSFVGVTVADAAAEGVEVTGSTANIDFGDTTVTVASPAHTDGISLSNNTSGTRTFGNITITGGSGVGFRHFAASGNGGGAVSVTGATNITNPANNGIDIRDSNASLTFAGTTITKNSTAGHGVISLNNTGDTITFSTLAVVTSNGVGLSATGGGTINVTNGAGSFINATGVGSNGAAIAAANVALGLNFTTISSTNSTAGGVTLNNVTGALTVNNGGGTATSISNPSGAAGIFVGTSSTSTTGYNFGNTSVTGSGATGIGLTGNSAPVSFGALTVTPDGNQRGLHSTGSTGTITISSGTITTTNNAAVEIVGAGGGASRTPLNIALTQVNTSGGPNGIVLTDTSANPGGFAVNGDGDTARDGSGGHIQNTTDDGVRLTNAATVKLEQMNFTSTGDLTANGLGQNQSTAGTHAIEMSGGTSNVTISAVTVTDPGGSGVMALNTTGTSRVNLGSLFTDFNSGNSHGVFVNNEGGFTNTLFEINDTDFTDFTSTAQAVRATNAGTGNLTIEVENGIFEAIAGQAVLMTGGNAANTTGTLTSDVNGNIFRNARTFTDPNGNAGSTENNAAALVTNGATHNAQIRNNVFDNIGEYTDLAGLSIIRTQNSGGKMTVSVVNNEIKNINNAANAGGRHMIGHVFEPSDNVFDGTDYSNVTIDGNTANNVTYTNTTREFIFVDYRVFASGGTVSIKNNLWNMPSSSNGGAAEQAIELRFRQQNASSVNILVNNNGVGTKNGVTGATSNVGNSVSYLDIDSEESASINATITNNAFIDLDTTGAMIAGATEDNVAAGTGAFACFDVRSNTVTLPTAGNGIQFSRVHATTTLNVEQTSTGDVSTKNNGTTVGASGSPSFGVACSDPPPAAPDEFGDIAAQSAQQEGQSAPQAAASGNFVFAPPVPAPPIGEYVMPFNHEAFAAAALQQRAAAASAAQAGTAQAAPDAAKKASAAKASAAPGGSRAGSAQPRKGGAKDGSKGGGVAKPSDGTFTVNIGTLPAQDEVTITYKATIAATLTPAAAESVSNQAKVTADGGINKDSDDPETGTAGDATVTNVDKFEPVIDITTLDNDTDQGEPVTLTATLTHGTALVDPLPTGTVSFVDQTDANSANWEVLCSNVTLTVGASSSTAQCVTKATDPGAIDPGSPRTIAAVYSGDGRYDPATDTVAQTVTACFSGATAVVTSAADDGSAGTLRNIIGSACTGATITFDIDTAGNETGPHTIALVSGELLIQENLTISGPTDESVTVSGGASRAFRVTQGTVNFNNLTIADSDPTGASGGGLLVEGATSVVTVLGMTFSGNSALSGGGGAMAVIGAGAVLNVINTTVSGNAANGGGGLVNNGGTLNLVNVTVTNNDANLGDTNTPGAGVGGGVQALAGTTTVRNSIVTGNLGTSGNENVNGTITDQGNNLLTGDALLGPLAANGGPTKTHKLLAGSPALDAGNNCVTTAGGCVPSPADPVVAVSTDQRGFDRAADAADAGTTDTVDIGAFEAQASVQTFADASIKQDTSHTVTDFQIGDADSNLTVAATSDNTTLVPNANIAINAGSSSSQRTLVVTPASGQTGTANITVTVTDTASGDAMSDTFQLTVSAKESPTVTITADSPDPSNSGQAVTVTFTVTGGMGAPTGNVVITASGGAETCQASVATGTCDITLTAAGARTLTATYSGDGTYTGGTDTEPHAVLPNVTVSNSTASEASELATFTVHLDVPSTDTVTVNFTTADEPAGPGKAVAGQDYTPTNGNVVFTAGQTLKTISVPVTNDGQTGEPDETFLVNLTSATNGNVSAAPADNQATGTITEANNAGALLISEIRTSGPGGAGDQFVELYNNSDAPVTLNATDASAGYSLAASNNGCAADPVVLGIIPNGTTIPARGHYLFVGSAYSLAASATGNLPLAADITADSNVALFTTSDLRNFSSQTRVDAVGFFDGVNGLGGNCDLLREGTPLNAAQGSTSQYSFFRRLSSGRPQDTGRSVDDFQLVSTTPPVAVGFNSTPQLGAPGPENIQSPIQRNDKIKATLIDSTKGAQESPNSVRRQCGQSPDQAPEECDANRSNEGTFSIRRRWTNKTGQSVTSLRFRLVNVTTGPTPAAGTADLRAITSGQVSEGAITIEGTTLEGPTQALGGGFNSTLAVGTIDLSADPLVPDESIVVQFLLGVQQGGAYAFFVNAEAGPPPAGPVAPAKMTSQPGREGAKAGATGGKQ